MPLQWQKRTRHYIRQWNERNDQETSRSGKEKHILQSHRATPGTGDYQISSRVFYRTMRTGGWDIMEVSAPAEAEEVVL
jgi:hypothetical protein